MRKIEKVKCTKGNIDCSKCKDKEKCNIEIFEVLEKLGRWKDGK